MIYLNFGINPRIEHIEDSKNKGFIDIDNWNPQDLNSVFYYDRHDLALRRVRFSNFISNEQWEFFKTVDTSKIIVNYSDDYFNQAEIGRFADALLERQVDNSRIIFICMDKNYEDFLRKGLIKRGISKVSITNVNVLMKRVKTQFFLPAERKYKFSVLSRNYYKWRLELYLHLLNKGILKESIYSFHNYNPYGDIRIFSLEEIQKDAEDLLFTNEGTKEWVSKLPYDIGNKSLKFDKVTYKAIQSADINIVVESHFDPFLYNIFSEYKNQYTPETIAPGFITEKTWKAIICKKPFFVVATPYTLKDLRKLGFETFSPFIDETYDTIENNTERLQAIVKELDRINNLGEEEYTQLLNNLQVITANNLDVFKKLQSDHKAYIEYPFLSKIIRI